MSKPKTLDNLSTLHCIVLSSKRTAKEFGLTRLNQVFVLLLAEEQQKKYGHCSKAYLMKMGLISGQSLVLLTNKGYIQKTDDWHVPRLLSPSGKQVCEVFRKHYRELSRGL